MADPSPPLEAHVEDARIWLLLGEKHGDNMQVRTLAQRLAEASREWPLSHNAWREVPAAVQGASLRSLRDTPDFRPPWPDLLIGAGRRNVPVARWIKAQNQGRTKLVWIGRPRAPLRYFDLILTTAQYGLPRAANVQHLALPFTQVQPTGRGHRTFAILGGPSWSAIMDTAFLNRFADAARGGEPDHLTIATSPRSPDGAGALLRARIGGEAEIYDWKAARGQDNPYRAWLEEADSFLISGDSVSVLSDAVATGRPVTVLPVPKPRWLSAVTATRIGRRWIATGGNAPVFAPPPNLDAIFADLIDKGLAEKRGDGLYLPNALPAVADDHAQAVRRVLALLPDRTGDI